MQTARASLFELCDVATQIRQKHLLPCGTKYNKKFHQFWQAYKMQEIFGSLANFTKYACAGATIEEVKTQYPKALRRLPTSLTSLYELSLLKPEEKSLCLSGEESICGEVVLADVSPATNDNTCLKIKSTTTALEIKKWKTSYRRPEKAKLSQSDYLFASIKIAGNLIPVGGIAEIDLKMRERIDAFKKELKAIISAYDDVELISEFHEEKSLLRTDKNLTANALKREKQDIRIAQKLENKILSIWPHQNKDYLAISNNCRAELILARQYFRVIQLDDEKIFTKKGKMKIINAMSRPKPKEYLLALMRDYHDRFGSRRLLSLIYRTDPHGPWGKTEQAEKRRRTKNKVTGHICVETRRVKVRVLVEELTKYRKIILAEIGLENEQKMRAGYHELITMLAPQFAAMNEHELDQIAARILSPDLKIAA